MAEIRSRRLEWARPARAAYEATIDRITGEDPVTAGLVEARVARSLALLMMRPGLGTPSVITGRRVYAVPRTGHTFNYRVTDDVIYILRWYRQRQNVPR